ncbi:hypothetical protein ABW21_db0208621 [Orbilia brochopaga]|nr:hypothetical protein ABW21_db0208621 [Drechslerella brochopaga]
MSDDKSNQSQTPPNPSTPGSAPSEPRRPEPPQDLFSTVRRLADEHISAALHSVFGIPSILQPPSPNWIMDDNDRNHMDGMNRREGADDSNRDDDNKGGSGSSAAGTGGPSGSSGQSGNSSAGSSSDRNRQDDKENNTTTIHIDLTKVPAPPEVFLPEMLFALGKKSAGIFEGYLNNHVQTMGRLIEEESIRQREISAAKLQEGFGPFRDEFKKLFELEASLKKTAQDLNQQCKKATDSQTIIIKGTQANNEEPKYTDLFGEDMYGSQRTQPLFTSLFDEFLPDGYFSRRQQPPSISGGRTMPAPSGIFPSSLYTDPFGHFFKFVTGPWLRTMHESWDPAFNDATRNVLDQLMMGDMKQASEGKVSTQDFDRAVQEEEQRIVQEHQARLNEKREELEKLLQTNEKKKIFDEIRDESDSYSSQSTDNQEPKTEHDLYQFFASIGGKKEASDEKVLVAQSTSTTRYSDGTVEREEHNEETASGQPPEEMREQSEERVGKHFRFKFNSHHETRSKILKDIRKHEREIRSRGDQTRVFELEDDEEKQETAVHQPKAREDDDGQEPGGGWSSWLWASDEKD